MYLYLIAILYTSVLNSHVHSRGLMRQIPTNSIPRKSSLVRQGDQELLASGDQIMELFYNSEKSQQSYQKASTVFLMKLFKELQTVGGTKERSKGTDLFRANTIRSFSAHPEMDPSKRTNRVVCFKIPKLPRHERLRASEIRLLRHPVRHFATDKPKFKIELRKRGFLIKRTAVKLKTKTQGDYEVIDVSRILKPVLNRNYDNITIHVRLPKRLRFSRNDRRMSVSALIVLYMEDEEFLSNVYKNYSIEKTRVADPNPDQYRQKRRRINRRHARNRSEKQKTGCALHNYNIDFNFIGWGRWVIHPKKYNARYCYGNCVSPIDVKYKPTNHAMLNAMMRLKQKNTTPVACCVPTKLLPLSMLYYEYGEIVLRHHEGMVASECGCR